MQPISTAEPAIVMTPIWRRALWMRLGALSGVMSVLIWLTANMAALDPGHADMLRLGAQIQFMHGMATLSCATFMNVGARWARLAPAFFLGGVLLFSFPLYLVVLGMPVAITKLVPIGIAALAAGWLILAWSAKDIDRD
jgi:uncharacterized membrane protein YgdD (TMEM256/DUF423 family)